VSIVQDSAQLDGGELISQSTDISVQSKAFKINMSDAQDSGAWRFVAPSRFHADESVLDDVNSSDTVFPAESIQREEDLDGIGVVFCLSRDGNFDWKPTLKFDGDSLGFLRRILRSSSQFPHVNGRGNVGVFENSSLVRDVEEIFVS